jgi:hypothetical protein
MKASLKLRSNLIVEVEAESQRDLFAAIASAYEVFAQRQCGLCACAELVPVYRTVTQGKKAFEYAEWTCTACHARLNLGAMIEGGRLFPHRRLDGQGKPDRETGTYGAHNGWTKYRGEATPEPTANGAHVNNSTAR